MNNAVSVPPLRKFHGNSQSQKPVAGETKSLTSLRQISQQDQARAGKIASEISSGNPDLIITALNELNNSADRLQVYQRLVKSDDVAKRELALVLVAALNDGSAIDLLEKEILSEIHEPTRVSAIACLKKLTATHKGAEEKLKQLSETQFDQPNLNQQLNYFFRNPVGSTGIENRLEALFRNLIDYDSLTLEDKKVSNAAFQLAEGKNIKLFEVALSALSANDRLDKEPLLQLARSGNPEKLSKLLEAIGKNGNMNLEEVVFSALNQVQNAGGNWLESERNLIITQAAGAIAAISNLDKESRLRRIHNLLSIPNATLNKLACVLLSHDKSMLPDDLAQVYDVCLNHPNQKVRLFAISNLGKSDILMQEANKVSIGSFANIVETVKHLNSNNSASLPLIYTEKKLAGFLKDNFEEIAGEDRNSALFLMMKHEPYEREMKIFNLLPKLNHSEADKFLEAVRNADQLAYLKLLKDTIQSPADSELKKTCLKRLTDSKSWVALEYYNALKEIPALNAIIRTSVPALGSDYLNKVSWLNPEQKKNLIYDMMATKDQRSIPFLRKLLEDPSDDIRFKAVESLNALKTISYQKDKESLYTLALHNNPKVVEAFWKVVRGTSLQKDFFEFSNKMLGSNDATGRIFARSLLIAASQYSTRQNNLIGNPALLKIEEESLSRNLRLLTEELKNYNYQDKNSIAVARFVNNHLPEYASAIALKLWKSSPAIATYQDVYKILSSNYSKTFNFSSLNDYALSICDSEQSLGLGHFKLNELSPVIKELSSHKINTAYRLPQDTVRQVINNRNELKQKNFKLKDDAKVLVYYAAEEDYNSALKQSSDVVFRDLANHKVYYFDLGAAPVDDLSYSIAELGRNKISGNIIFFSAHGDQYSLYTGNKGESLKVRDFSKLKDKGFSNILKKGGTILLGSCSTAKGLAAEEDFAKGLRGVFIQALDFGIIGPLTATALKKITNDNNSYSINFLVNDDSYYSRYPEQIIIRNE